MQDPLHYLKPILTLKIENVMLLTLLNGKKAIQLWLECHFITCKMEKSKVVESQYTYTPVDQKLSTNDPINDKVPTFGIRHVQVALYFLLCFIAFGFRVILAVLIVAMTNPNTSGNPDIPSYPHWQNKNIIHSAFFWGYVIPQVFAGWAASRFGAKWFLICMFNIQLILGILTPFTAAHFGSTGLIISRAIQGFTQGFIYPSITHLLSRWVPKEERSRLGTIVYAAGPLGTVVTTMVSGPIAASWYGWPMMWYLNGAVGFIWIVLMFFLGYDTPAQHPLISEAERFYIENSLGHREEKKRTSTPWKSFVTSVPVWACFITQTGFNFCFWTLLNQTPTYMYYVMEFNIKDNSLLSSLPCLSQWMMSFVIGWSSDTLINKGILTRTQGRKVFNSIALYGTAIMLTLLAYTNQDHPQRAVIFLVIGMGLSAGVFSGWMVNHIDLSPNHASSVMGLCNAFSQTTGAIAPLIVELIVTEQNDILQWRSVFLLVATINVVTGTVFNLFGSGDVQPWNYNDDEEENNIEYKL